MGAVPRQAAGNVSGIKRRTENSAEGRTRLDGRGGSLHCFFLPLNDFAIFLQNKIFILTYSKRYVII